MAKSAKKEAQAGIAEILAMFRHAFPSSESVLYLIALVTLRWLADSRRDATQLPCSITLPDGLEYHIPLTLHDDQLGHWFKEMFKQLEILNQHELAGVFSELNFASMRFRPREGQQGMLGRAVEILWFKDRYRCSFALMEEALAMARTILVASTAAPELNTPSALCELVASVLEPLPEETVYDPACGTGKMLFHCASQAASPGHMKMKLYGAERHRPAWMLAKVNALFHGFSSEHIQLCDALQPDNVLECCGRQLRFDVVASHPPWGVKEWRDERPPAERYDRFRRGLPPRNNADYAYLLHMVSSLKEDTGRMAAVVAGGVLSRGAQEGRIRQRLLKDNLVDSVIALPDKMFQGTPVGGAILIMRRDRTRRDVLFIDARTVASLSAGKNTFSDDALGLIRHACKKRTDEPGFSAIASFDSIIENGYSLSVSLYVRAEQDSNSTDVHGIPGRRARIRADLDVVNARIDALVAAINAGAPPSPRQLQRA